MMTASNSSKDSRTQRRPILRLPLKGEGRVFDVKVVDVHGGQHEYEHRATNAYDAISDAIEKYGVNAKVHAKPKAKR